MGEERRTATLERHARGSGRATRSAAFIALAAVVVAFTGANAQPQALDDVLDRLGVYVLDYEDDLSLVVAEEEYLQALHGQNSPRYRRSLVSDFAFSRPSDNGPWVGFRDTFLVDGREVRGRDARLERLLTSPTASTFEQAARIVEENARYNLASDRVHRNINSPILTVDFLHPRYRGRFSFRKRREERIDGRLVWRIDFEEHGEPRVIRTPDGSDQETRGTVWVDPTNGAVLRTFLQVKMKGLGSQAQLTVSFRVEPKLELLVPHDMRESYTNRAFPQINGTATYSRFRRFETSGRILEK